MKKIKCIRQHDSRDCAAACVLMICSHYDMNYSMNKVREAIGVDNNGTNIYAIEKGCRELGFIAEGLNGNYDELEQYYFENGKKPFIAHIVNEEKFEHFVVVAKIKTKKIYIADPMFDSMIVVKKEDFIKVWTGNIVSFKKINEKETNNEKEESKYLKWFKKYKKYIIYSVVATVTIEIIALLSAYSLGYLLEKGNDYTKQFVLVVKVICIFSIIYILRAMIEVYREMLITRTSTSINKNITKNIVDGMLEMPYSCRELYRTGDLLTRIENIDVIGTTFLEAIISISMNGTLFVMCGMVLLNHNKMFMGITLVFMVLYICVFILFDKPIRRRNQELLLYTSNYNSGIKEAIDAYELVTVHGLKKSMYSKINSALEKKQNCIIQNDIIHRGENAVLSLLSSIYNIILVCIGMYYVNLHQIKLSEFLIVYMAALLFQSPLMSLVEIHPKLKYMKNEIDRLEDIFKIEKGSEVDKEIDCENVSNISLKKNIVFENVSYTYKMKKTVFSNINLHISVGEKVGIVGKSGSGKTTLMKLLLRLYEDYTGDIRIGKLSINAYPEGCIREKIAYISQKFEFFSDSLRYNLVFDKNIDDNEIMSVLEKCSCKDIVDRLQYGLDTVVDYGANVLSTGEKQRLIIARELIKKPDIIILDEVTSNLDDENAINIRQTIEMLDKDITCIIISHRKDMLSICDNVYSLDKS